MWGLKEGLLFCHNHKAIFLILAAALIFSGRRVLLSDRKKKGWKHWARRFEYDGALERHGLPEKRWRQSEKLDGKLLVCSEQGIGDEILYLSCLPDLLKQHKAIVIECDKRWGPIFRRSFPRDNRCAQTG